MKFALLINEFDKQLNGEYLTNIGNNAMTIALELLLYEMNVKKSDIVYIPYSDIGKYNGEYIILLINMHWMQDVGNKILFNLSKKIIPVFLSISLNDMTITNDQAIMLRRYEPIGCRDERTMMTLRDNNIDAFIMGCLTATLEKTMYTKERKKVLFADVPFFIKNIIPSNIKRNIEFIKHELNINEIPDGMSPREYTESILEKYREEASLVVTSRFHGAMLALAYGIPVILINENFTFRFSSLYRLIPYYTKENYKEIDWNPSLVDIEIMKYRMKHIAKKLITKAVEKYEDIYYQSSLLEYSNWKSAGLIDYYDEAIEYIEMAWDKNKEIQYGIWGVNNNAEAIHSYISENFPNAKLYMVYDAFQEIEFKGIKSISPEYIEKSKDLFIFVTTFVAGYIAEKVFFEKGIDKSQYFICRRKYITEVDL